MPFKIQSQMRYMYANHPALAKEFADKTVNMKNLPEHVSDDKKRKKMVEHMTKKA